MNPALLDGIPLWFFFVAAVGLTVAALELGYRAGLWRHAHSAGEKEAPVGAMVGSILALVAIILAFSFNLAAMRFESRRAAVLDEANAVGTTWLRARTLPEPERSNAASLLKQYVDARLKMAQDLKIAEGLARSAELHEQLWSQAVSAAEKSPTDITALFLVSLNEVIDLHATRMQAGLRSRFPAALWIALFALALLGMLSMGYQTGLSATRRTPAEVLLALAFAGVLLLIVDLDRAHEGFLRVSQQPLIDLQKSMQHGLQAP